MAIPRLIAFVFALLLVPSASARQTSVDCKSKIRYQNRNQVDYHPLIVFSLSGRAFAEAGDPPGEIGPVTSLCIGLFTERKHKFVAATLSDKEGRFEIDSIPTGAYRLVAVAEGLCVANVPLRVVRSANERPKNKRIVLHMRPASVDKCSYGDYK